MDGSSYLISQDLALAKAHNQGSHNAGTQLIKPICGFSHAQPRYEAHCAKREEAPCREQDENENDVLEFHVYSSAYCEDTKR